MTTGTLTAEAEEAGALQHDVLCILMRFHRQQGLQSLRFDATPDQLRSDAEKLSVELGAAIGGRYLPKHVMKERQRRERDQAVYLAFNGRNRPEVMKMFGISRALFYNIIARMQKVQRI
jgi:Mor family transcriptional regulator